MKRSADGKPKMNGDYSGMNGDSRPKNAHLCLAGYDTYEEIEKIAKDIQNRVKCRPQLGIICGSGLGGLADLVEDKETISYFDIEGFPVSTVPGHQGQFVFGKLRDKPVIIMQGRVHVYEGYPLHKVTLPIKILKLMGVTTLFITNAAGGINRDYNVGDIMIMKDHFNIPGFSGLNPLIGPNDDRFGPRFPALSNAYDFNLRNLAKKCVKELGYTDFCREGVYSMLSGPSYETVTECKFLLQCGVDATGMSTVPEATVAVYCGMKVFGLSLITNSCIMEYDCKTCANHEEVLETAKLRSKDVQTLISKMVAEVEV